MAIYIRDEQGDLIPLNIPAINGRSAYEVACDNGFEGTEQEWLNSLHGDKGDKGIYIGELATAPEDADVIFDNSDEGVILEGIAPNITIGKVTTVDSGQPAKVSRSGTNMNPIFDFEIPKGADGGSGKKLIARYIHNSNKTVQPTALDLASGVFTCDTPHNLIEGKKLWLRYNGDTAPANIPIELYNVTPGQWGRGQLKAHIIDEFSFQVYVKNGEFISFTNEKNKNVDVSKFSFEYDLQQIFINNINCNSIDFYCNGFVTGGYFAVTINYIDSRVGQSDANASMYGQVPSYISYKGTTNFTEGKLSTHINLTSKTINYPAYTPHRSNGMKELLISYSVKPNSSYTNIKDIRPAFGEVYPLNGFIVEIWGGE